MSIDSKNKHTAKGPSKLALALLLLLPVLMYTSIMYKIIHYGP